MELSVTKVKVLEHASEETLCFEARLVLDGRDIGVVSNAGRGGSHRYALSAPREVIDALDEEAARRYPEFAFEQLDSWVDSLIVDALYAQELAKLRRGHVVLRDPSDPEGVFHQVKIARGRTRAEVEAYCRERWPESAIV